MYLPETLPPQPLKTLYTRSHCSGRRYSQYPHTKLVVQTRPPAADREPVAACSHQQAHNRVSSSFCNLQQRTLWLLTQHDPSSSLPQTGPLPAELPSQSQQPPVTGDCCMDAAAKQHRDETPAAGTSFFKQCRHFRCRCRRQCCCCCHQRVHKSSPCSAAATTLLTPAGPGTYPLPLARGDALVVA